MKTNKFLTIIKPTKGKLLLTFAFIIVFFFVLYLNSTFFAFSSYKLWMEHASLTSLIKKMCAEGVYIDVACFDNQVETHFKNMVSQYDALSPFQTKLVNTLNILYFRWETFLGALNDFYILLNPEMDMAGRSVLHEFYSFDPPHMKLLNFVLESSLLFLYYYFLSVVLIQLGEVFRKKK